MSAVYNSTVQGFYLSYYGRPADPAGLAFWTGQLAAANGNLDAILNAFGTSAEATRRYGTGTDASKIEAIYQQTFGRAADATGLAFYQQELAAGRMTLINASKRIIDGAAGDDIPTRANRLTAAQSFTDKLDTDAERAGYSGSGAEDAARAWVATVTKDAATVTAAVASADSTITSLLPQTFNLTVNADSWTGSAGNDTASGTVSNLGGTFNVGDKLDGGAGQDTLNLSVSTNWTGLTTGSVKGIETVAITNSSGAATEFDAKSFSGVETYKITSTGSAFTLTGHNTGLKSIEFDGGQRERNLTTSFETTAPERQVTTDSISLSLTKVGRVDPTDATGASFNRSTVTIGDVETINLKVNNDNYATFGTGVRALNVTGDGTLNVNLDTGHTSLRTFDASAVKGAVRVDLSASTTAAQISSVKTGDGNDTITVAREDLTQTATIAGGAGTNSLVLSSVNGGAAQIVQYAMTGVQTLDIRAVTANTANTHTLTFAGSNTTGLTTIATRDTTAANVILSGVSGNLTFNSTGATVADGAVSSDTSGTAALNFKQSTTALAAKTTETALATYTFSKASGVTVNVEPFIKVSSTGAISTAPTVVNAAEATSFALNVGTGKDLAGTEQTVLAGAFNFAKATTGTISVDGQVSSARVIAPELKTLTITNGATTGTVLIDTGGLQAQTGISKMTSLSVTSGSALTVTGTGYGSDGGGAAAARMFSGLQTLTIAANKGAVNLNNEGVTNSNLPKINTLTLSGSGTDSAIKLGNLGGDNGYGLTLTSTGLKAATTGATAGLEVGTITTSPGQAVTLNLTGTSGLVKIGAIAGATGQTFSTATGTYSGGSSTTTGAVTINAAGVGSNNTDATQNAVTIGDINSSGAVSVDVSGTRNPSVGAITGSSVTVNMADVTSPSVALGTVTATSAVDLTLYNLLANTLAINGASSQTAFTARLTGGALKDDITFTSTATGLASITVTGDLRGATDDVLKINATAALAKTVNISGLSNYDNSIITTGSGADTITGGSGSDTFRAGAGANVLTGGAGADVFEFGTGATVSRLANTGGESSITTITDLQAIDRFVFADANINAVDAVLAEKAISGAAASASGNIRVYATGAVDITGATASGYDTLTKKVALIDRAFDTEAAVGTVAGTYAFFRHDGTVYLYINSGDDDGVSYDQSTVVKLSGITTLPGEALTAGTTGLVGFGS